MTIYSRSGRYSARRSRRHAPSSGRPSQLLLRAERLALLTMLGLLTLLVLAAAEALAGVFTLARAHADQLLQAVLNVTLAVMRLVRDACDKVVHAGGRIHIRGADLAELVKDAVADLTPVLAKLLLDLPLLLVVHS
ncbi:hypothetical protein FAGKG844_100057 [Frankia sp. AgKG'84/4]